MQSDLLSALIGLGGALIGSLIGGAFALRGARLEAHESYKLDLRRVEDEDRKRWVRTALEWDRKGGADTLREANLEGAYLQNVYLSWRSTRTHGGHFGFPTDGTVTVPGHGAADLRRSNLRRADLRHAELMGVDLTDADVQGTDFRGASLHDACLIGIKHGEDALWEGATDSEQTQWPQGWRPTGLTEKERPRP